VFGQYDVHQVMNIAAIKGLDLNALSGDRGFRVVTNDRNGSPQHSGIFPQIADAKAYCAAKNELSACLDGYKVVAFRCR
jgi:hypothetical protein